MKSKNAEPQLGLFAPPVAKHEPSPEVIAKVKVPYGEKELSQHDICAKCSKDKWEHWAGFANRCPFWTAEALENFAAGRPLRHPSSDGNAFCYGCCRRDQEHVVQCRITKPRSVTWYRLCLDCRRGYAEQRATVEVWSEKERGYVRWTDTQKASDTASLSDW